MSSSKRNDQALGRASLYATRHSPLFFALAPAVVCSLIILIPLWFASFSVPGLGIVLGVSGLSGLLGLTLAWLGLLTPRLAARFGWILIALLAASLPVIVLALCTAFINKHGAPPRHTIDVMLIVAPTAAVFSVLAVFFVSGILKRRSAAEGAGTTSVRRWRIASIIVVCLTLPLPLGCLLVAGGYGKTLRQAQAAQADVLSQRAMAAVDAYRATHDGAFPVDNASAGLPDPNEMRSTHVASVAITKSMITLRYGNNVVTRMLGAAASDVQLIFLPHDVVDSTYPPSKPVQWGCFIEGYRHKNDVPLMLNGRCQYPGGIVITGS